MPRDDHRTRAANFSFGTTAKLRDFSAGVKVPGPGDYTPVDPNIAAQRAKSAFTTSSDRLPKRNVPKVPPPGQYQSTSSLSQTSWSWGGRHGKKDFVGPGPGAYSPVRTQVARRERQALVESGPDRDPFKNRKITPGPGNYTTITDMGKQAPTMRSCPNFSMQSTRRPYPTTDGPTGPVMTCHSGFD